MGQEARCTAEFKGSRSAGKLLLETDALIFRGNFRLLIPYKHIEKIDSAGGQLSIRFSDGTAKFELGALADKWAQRLRAPRTLFEKLGLRRDATVTVLGVQDQAFLEGLRKIARDVRDGRLRSGNDLIFFGAGSNDELKKLKTLQAYLKRDGAIWVIRPKGRKEITEAGVMAAGKAAGSSTSRW